MNPPLKDARSVQRTACFTSSLIFAASVALNTFSAKRCMHRRGLARYRRGAARAPAVRTRRCPTALCAPEELRIAEGATACAAMRPSSVCLTAPSLLGVGLIRSHRAVGDIPDVAVRVGEGAAVPAPLQLRRRLEDRRAGRVGLLHNLVDARLAAHDVVEDDATETAAVGAGPDHVGQALAAVEADERAAVGNEEDRDLVVTLDLPAQTVHVEALGSLHVLDAKQNCAYVRVHLCLLLVVIDRTHRMLRSPT